MLMAGRDTMQLLIGIFLARRMVFTLEKGEECLTGHVPQDSSCCFQALPLPDCGKDARRAGRSELGKEGGLRTDWAQTLTPTPRRPQPRTDSQRSCV